MNVTIVKYRSFNDKVRMSYFLNGCYDHVIEIMKTFDNQFWDDKIDYTWGYNDSVIHYNKKIDAMAKHIEENGVAVNYVYKEL